MPSARKKSTIFPFLLARNARNFVLRTENLQKLSIFFFGFWLKIVPLLGKFPGDAHVSYYLQVIKNLPTSKKSLHLASCRSVSRASHVFIWKIASGASIVSHLLCLQHKYGVSIYLYRSFQCKVKCTCTYTCIRIMQRQFGIISCVYFTFSMQKSCMTVRESRNVL